MHSLERIVALLPLFSPVCPSLCPSDGMGVHCDHTVHVHVSADLTLWLDSPMFWASKPYDSPDSPDEASPDWMTKKDIHLISAVSFQFHLEERWGYGCANYFKNGCCYHLSARAYRYYFPGEHQHQHLHHAARYCSNLR